MNLSRTCRKCEFEKHIDCFSKTNSWRKNTCRECVKKIEAQYRAENKDAVARNRRNYYEKNKLHATVKAAISAHLSGRRDTKTSEILNSLGYSIDDLRMHIESSFTDGMSWDNYGQFGWHIDHIFPISRLPAERHTDKNFVRAWSLNNLRPLWWRDNLIKGNSLP